MKAPACFSRWRAGIYGAVLSFGAACTGAPSDGAATAGGPSDGAPADGGAAGQAPEGGGSIAFPTGGAGGSAALVDVDVTITADNAYSFGYGDAGGIVHFTQGTRAEFAAQIFNCGEGPEAYVVPAADAPPGAYLYIVAWDDLFVTQGVLGQFRRGDGTPLYTGQAEFEVCATGVDLQDSQTGPGQADINAQVAICNSGSGDPSATSKGWVNAAGAVTAGALGTLAIGEANSAGDGNFPPVCPTETSPPDVPTIDGAAQWMWYQPGGIGNPFQSTGSNIFKAYLIFRVAAQDIPPPPR